MSAKLLNKTTLDTNKSGSRWLYSYIVHKDDISDYTYEYMDDANGITGVVGSYVSDFKKTPKAQHFYVFITISSIDYETTERFEKVTDCKGDKYSMVYRVLTADLATYTYDYGDDADSLTGGTGTYVTTWNRKEVENGYFVFITAVSAEYETVDKQEKENNKSGVKWTLVYKVADADIADHTYIYGASTDTLTGGTGTYCMNWRRRECEGFYFVYLTAVSSGYEASEWSFKTTDKTFRSYDTGLTYMKPEWFGARRASATDDTNGIFTFLTGNACKEGDFIYKNATTSSAGTQDDTESPFSNTGGLSDANVKKVIGQSLSSSTFTVSFLTTSNIDNFETWIGVNGSFGSASTRPATTTSGTWLAVSQKVTEASTPLGDPEVLYTKVIRKMRLAPQIGASQFLWDPDRNGGEWSW